METGLPKRPEQMSDAELAAWSAQTFVRTHVDDYLPCQENHNIMNRYMHENGIPSTLEGFNQAYSDLKEKNKIIPPFEALDLENKPPEAVLAAAKKYGIRKVDYRGKEVWDFPEAWSKVPPRPVRQSRLRSRPSELGPGGATPSKRQWAMWSSDQQAAYHDLHGDQLPPSIR